VELVRADPSLLTELQLGAFFHAYWRRRLVRHVASRSRLAEALAHFPGPTIGVASDLAFWAGVRSIASTAEWQRFTRSYVVFYYHRIGLDGWPGQEHLNLHSRRFEHQLRLLQLLRFHALAPDELIAFHTDPGATLPRRSYVLTADDALRDAVAAFHRHADLHPQVFVNTSAVGSSPWWAFDQRVADWEELRAFKEAGGVVGSHCRGHPRLATLDSDELEEELDGSLKDLKERLREVPALLAYPHGQHDEGVRSAAAAAGYRAAFTTTPGRNGAGTDVFCLRRVAIKDWDGHGALLWKTVTGELLPRRWEQFRMRLRRSKSTPRSLGSD
jgi:peptidoglycan/xylan/chitin deacetylase (PgdA/CDA1 family)